MALVLLGMSGIFLSSLFLERSPENFDPSLEPKDPERLFGLESVWLGGRGGAS